MQEKTGTILSKTFAKIVKYHRIQIGKSIYQISAEASVPKATWAYIENAFCDDIKLSNFLKISDGLEIEPDILMKELKEKLGKDFSLEED